jgi:hypothetical protein
MCYSAIGETALKEADFREGKTRLQRTTKDTKHTKENDERTDRMNTNLR